MLAGLGFPGRLDLAEPSQFDQPVKLRVRTAWARLVVQLGLHRIGRRIWTRARASATERTSFSAAGAGMQELCRSRNVHGCRGSTPEEPSAAGRFMAEVKHVVVPSAGGG